MKFHSIAVLLLASTMMVGCVEEPKPAPGPVGKNLPNCARVESNAFASYKELPITDEGNGFIGVGTTEENAEGRSYQRFSLVDCVNKQVVRVEGEWKLGQDTATGSENTDVFSMVNGLRDRSRLANITYLTQQAKDQGFKVSSGKLPKTGDPRVQRSDCGCYTYYPDTMPEQTEVVF